jgi:hypothetical protein
MFFRYILSRGAKVNVIGGVLKSTPLHWAARQGHIRIVALLVNGGADLTIRDVEGFTPLHVAVQVTTNFVAYSITDSCTSVCAYTDRCLSDCERTAGRVCGRIGHDAGNVGGMRLLFIHI